MPADHRPLHRELVRGILRTLDHIADDDYFGYLERVARLVPLPELFRTLSRMIGRRRVTQDPALFFLQDCLVMLPDPLNGEMRAQLFGSALDREIRALLLTPDNHFLRSRIGYFLGKTCPPGAEKDLSEAILAFAEKDPLALPGFLFELRWLLRAEGEKVLDPLLADLAGRSLYLTRWAVVHFYRNFGVPSGETLPASHLERLRLLAADPVSVVREEAAFRLRELDFVQDSPGLSKAERRQRRREIKQTQPRMELKAVEIHFRNLLCESCRNDYSIAELADFVQALLDHPSS
jgi:hypothetical protein